MAENGSISWGCRGGLGLTTPAIKFGSILWNKAVGTRQNSGKWSENHVFHPWGEPRTRSGDQTLNPAPGQDFSRWVQTRVRLQSDAPEHLLRMYTTRAMASSHLGVHIPVLWSTWRWKMSLGVVSLQVLYWHQTGGQLCVVNRRHWG